MTVKVLAKGELLKTRLASAEYAKKHITAEEAHEQMRKNGSVPSPNPFYTGEKTEEECYELLNEV